MSLWQAGELPTCRRKGHWQLTVTYVYNCHCLPTMYCITKSDVPALTWSPMLGYSGPSQPWGLPVVFLKAEALLVYYVGLGGRYDTIYLPTNHRSCRWQPRIIITQPTLRGRGSPLIERWFPVIQIFHPYIRACGTLWSRRAFVAFSSSPNLDFGSGKIYPDGGLTSADALKDLGTAIDRDPEQYRARFILHVLASSCTLLSPFSLTSTWLYAR